MPDVSRLKVNIIANLGGQLWASLLGFLLVPVYLRYLGVEAYGLVGFFASLQAIISVLDLGLSTTANREVARRSASSQFAAEAQDLMRTLEVIYLVTCIVIGMAFLLASSLVASSWIIAEKLSPQTIRLAVIILGLTVALRWPLALYTGILRGTEKQLLLNAVTASSATLRGIGSVVVLLYISPTIIAFLTWQLLLAVAEVLVMVLFAHQALPSSGERRPQFSFPILKSVWKFSAGVGMISILAIILKQLDKILISKMLPLGQLGYYTTAAIAASSVYWVVSPIVQAIFPRLSILVLEKDTVRLAATFHKSAQVISLFVAPIASIFIFFATDILFLWTRSVDISQHAGPVLMYLSISSLFNAMMQVPYSLQLSAGITWISLWNNGIAVIFLTPFIFYMVATLGITGGAIAWAIFNILYFFITPHVMHRHILPGHAAEWFTRDTLPFMIVGVGSFWIMRRLVAPIYPLAVVFTIAGGCVLYLLTVSVIHKSIRTVIWDWCGQLRIQAKNLG